MLLSMTATPRPGLTAPVSTGRRPRTITVRKLPHRTTHGYLMMLREKHPGFTFSLPSSSISERREIVFWPARPGGGVVLGLLCGAQLCGWDYIGAGAAGAGVVAGAEATPGARLLGRAATGERMLVGHYTRLTNPG